MKRAFAIGLAVVGGVAAEAAACPRDAVIAGDDAVVAEIAELLRRRGIEGGASDASCPAVRAKIARRDDVFVVDVTGADGAQVERVVGELATAATVIESFTRSDFAAPLLAVRMRPEPAPAGPLEQPPPAERLGVPLRGVQLFGALESSVATDRTRWMGMQLGVCISLGPLCAAARLRFASVLGGKDTWAPGLKRGATELLVGIDIPLSLSPRIALSPGFAAGLGAMHTGSDDDRSGHETAGPRADAHATLNVQLARRWALDLSVAFDMTQETRKFDVMPSEVAIPDEPLGLLRFGLGFRYGGM